MESQMTGRPTTILLAEDRDDHAELILNCLNGQRLTRRIIRVANGEETLDYLFNKDAFSDPEKRPLPDLILLDLRMPKIAGFEVLKELKSSEGLRRTPSSFSQRPTLNMTSLRLTIKVQTVTRSSPSHFRHCRECLMI